MAVLTKVKLNPQQRLDLEDYNAEISAIETDWKNWTKQFLAPEQYILKGFEVTGLGAPAPISVSLTDATLVNANNTNCFSFFTAEDGAAPLSVDLQPNQRNFLELELSRVDGTPLVRAFWDPTGNGGEGVEFNQTVDTMQDMEVNVVVNTSAFTGSANRIPLAIIDTDGSNNVELILDKRPMFFRLGQPGNVEKNFAWGSQDEPAVTLTLSSVVGSFEAGETLNFTGGASAELLSGISTPLQAIKFSSDSFEIGDTVTGATSGATGTLVTASESFSGADKNIGDIKEVLDAIMTEIKAIKGTDFWFNDGFKSLSGSFDQHNSVMIQVTSAARFSWDGSALSITDNSGTPANTDTVGRIVVFGQAGNLNMTRQDGTGGSSTISIADNEVLFVKIPAAGNRDYSGVGTGNTNYQIVNKDLFVQSDENYWIAYRSGAKLYLRGLQELEAGEQQEIGDEISGDLLDALGIPENDPTPNYTSDIRGVAGESFLARISTLTLNQGDAQEDRSGFFRSDDPIVWDGTDVTFSSDIELRIPNTKTGTYATYTIGTGQSPVNLPNDGDIGYIEIDRTSPGAVTVQVASSLPAQTQADKDIIVLFQRVDAAAGNFLHIPFHKQVLRQGQSVFLGASGSGGGVTRVDLYDPLSTSLPSGASATIDGVSLANGDLVLFSNLGSGDNRIYEAQGVGSSITWTAQFAFENGQDPDDGDLVVIQRGDGFADQIGKFTGTEWEFNKTTRYFDGENYVEFESIKTVTLTDNTSNGTVFSVNAASSDNWVIHASIARGSTKEVKTLHLTHDGTDVSVSESGTDLGQDSGVDFTATISGSDLILQYNTTSTGNDATMKFFYFRWSDTAGGPGGVPTYSGAASSSVTAAGATGDIQFKDSGGGLGANSKFNWDNTNELVNMNNMEMLVSQAPATILDNQSGAVIYSFNATTFRHAIIEYALERDGEYRTGRMLCSNNGTTVGFSDDFVETPTGTGVSFSAVLNAGNFEVQYNSTNTGIDGTFTIMQVRRL